MKLDVNKVKKVTQQENHNLKIRGIKCQKCGFEHLRNRSLKVSTSLLDGSRQYSKSFEFHAIFGKILIRDELEG